MEPQQYDQILQRLDALAESDRHILASLYSLHQQSRLSTTRFLAHEEIMQQLAASIGRMDHFAARVDQHTERLDQHLTRQETLLQRLDAQLAQHTDRMDRLEAINQGVQTTLARIETLLARLIPQGENGREA